MDRRAKSMILYRGSLKSCNYKCSYCPFSKHPGSGRELLKDREQWQRFCGSVESRAEKMGIGGVMVVPYGEALIHPWYWEGLGRLGALEVMDGVGAQTNLSFSLEKSLEIFKEAGGTVEKLRLWTTFHPEAVQAEAFAQTCARLVERGVSVCAGAVGVPKNLEVIQRLYGLLPHSVYLWINKMDGLGRGYTREEQKAFEEIDPYFQRELEPVPAAWEACGGRLFVEGDGRLRRCNISRFTGENWYELENWPGEEERELKLASVPGRPCGSKLCSCYLAYGGREDGLSRGLFGPYPLFRIPVRPKAAFLDIDKTLIPEGQSCIPRRTIADIRALAKGGCRLFFATSLPFWEAEKRCREVWPLFEGGIFAGGGHVVFQKNGEKQEVCLPLGAEWLSLARDKRDGCGFRVLVCRAGGSENGEGSRDCSRGAVCKITLLCPKARKWDGQEAEKIRALWGCREISRTETEADPFTPLRGMWEFKGERVRWFVQDNCLQMVHEKASKEEGVRIICQSLGIAPEETFAAGDSPEDWEMVRLCRKKR